LTPGNGATRWNTLERSIGTISRNAVAGATGVRCWTVIGTVLSAEVMRGGVALIISPSCSVRAGFFGGAAWRVSSGIDVFLRVR
jgi:hypothetical protein